MNCKPLLISASLVTLLGVTGCGNNGTNSAGNTGGFVGNQLGNLVGNQMGGQAPDAAQNGTMGNKTYGGAMNNQPGGYHSELYKDSNGLAGPRSQGDSVGTINSASSGTTHR